jgi:mannose-6-phosphate isomerase-like protein (cupin superfamily)
MRHATNDKKLEHSLEHIGNIAMENVFFRKVFYTGEFGQLVLMSIPPGGEIGENEYRDADCFLFILEGEGEAVLKSKRRAARKGDVMVVSAGSRHNLKNSGHDVLKLVAIYTSPEFGDDAICKTREDALAADWKALEHAWEQ